MWFRKQGLVAKVKDDYCVIINRSGLYEKIPIPAAGARVGSEIVHQNPVVSSYIRPVLVAASLLILFLGYTLFHQATLPQAMAYVSLDINPSLELSVDKNLKVIDVICFNNDAANLVKQESFKGKNLYDALAIIVNKAIAGKYIRADQDNLIITTVAPTATASTEAGAIPIDQKKIQQVLEKSMQSDGLNGEVKIYSVTDDFRAIAENSGLSPGKFLIYEQLKNTGAKIGIDEVKTNNINNLVATYRIGLLPDYRKISVKRHQTGEDPEIFVDNNGTTVPISSLSMGNNRKDISNGKRNTRVNNQGHATDAQENNQGHATDAHENNQGHATDAQENNQGHATAPSGMVRNHMRK
jgi:hypothetical protein